MDEWITLSEVARRLQVSEPSLRRVIIKMGYADAEIEESITDIQSSLLPDIEAFYERLRLTRQARLELQEKNLPERLEQRRKEEEAWNRGSHGSHRREVQAQLEANRGEFQARLKLQEKNRIEQELQKQKELQEKQKELQEKNRIERELQELKILQEREQPVQQCDNMKQEVDNLLNFFDPTYKMAEWRSFFIENYLIFESIGNTIAEVQSTKKKHWSVEYEVIPLLKAVGYTDENIEFIDSVRELEPWVYGEKYLIKAKESHPQYQCLLFVVESAGLLEISTLYKYIEKSHRNVAWRIITNGGDWVLWDTRTVTEYNPQCPQSLISVKGSLRRGQNLDAMFTLLSMLNPNSLITGRTSVIADQLRSQRHSGLVLEMARLPESAEQELMQSQIMNGLLPYELSSALLLLLSHNVAGNKNYLTKKIRNLLSQVWKTQCWPGTLQGGMTAEKFMTRSVHYRWAPLQFSFVIERHPEKKTVFQLWYITFQSISDKCPQITYDEYDELGIWKVCRYKPSLDNRV